MVASLERTGLFERPYPFASALQWHMAFQRWTKAGDADFLRAQADDPGGSIYWSALHPEALRQFMRDAPAKWTGHEYERWLEWEAADLSQEDSDGTTGLGQGPGAISSKERPS